MQRQRFLFAALGLLTLWRWALLPTLELAPDEALAVFRVKHGHGGGFPETGPMMPLLVRLGMLIGGDGEFGVRFFAPLLALAASLAVWRLMRSLFDAQIAGWAVVIVNVLPAFNLAAVTLTPSTVVFALVPAAALCLRVALLHAHPLHWAWWAAAACVLGTALAQPPALGVMLAVTMVFALPERLRHHLHANGFLVIVGFWSVGVLCWLWSGAHWDWPEWRLVPNLFRWIVLASPLLLVLFVLTGRMAWDRATLMSQRSLPLAMLLPLAALDLLYGPNHRWPDMGGAVWMVFAAMLLAHRGTVLGGIESEEKISLRTIALVLAALQSAFLLQTDLPRTLGLKWPFSRQTAVSSDYAHFFTADPSKAMRGWRESAKLVSATLRDGSWFVVADDWQLAVELDHYLGQTEPVVSIEADLSGFKGRGAIFVTDDPAAIAPPERLKARFGRFEVLSVARVMHAGNEVRWLKIFACHN
jgi:4-amino-4-deoxy-L-arabinose transferase-like glycosyltransferase